jgi:hypothetical protein
VQKIIQDCCGCTKRFTVYFSFNYKQLVVTSQLERLCWLV